MHQLSIQRLFFCLTISVATSFASFPNAQSAEGHQLSQRELALLQQYVDQYSDLLRHTPGQSLFDRLALRKKLKEEKVLGALMVNRPNISSPSVVITQKVEKAVSAMMNDDFRGFMSLELNAEQERIALGAGMAEEFLSKSRFAR